MMIWNTFLYSANSIPNICLSIKFEFGSQSSDLYWISLNYWQFSGILLYIYWYFRWLKKGFAFKHRSKRIFDPFINIIEFTVMATVYYSERSAHGLQPPFNVNRIKFNTNIGIQFGFCISKCWIWTCPPK